MKGLLAVTDPLESYLEKVEELIEKHGWTVQIAMDRRPFAYTVGLWSEQGKPELIVRGLSPETAISTLHSAIEELASKAAPWEAGMLLENVFSKFPAKMVPVQPEKVSQFLRVLKYFTDEQVPAWQILWPDRKGLFPGEPGADERILSIQDLDVPLTPEHSGTLQ